MRVAIVGAGPIGRATAAYLAHHRHEVGIWSPTGRSLAGLAADSASAARLTSEPEPPDRLRLAYEGEPSDRSRLAYEDESQVRLWLTYEGALTGRASIARIGSPEALGEFTVVVIAVPGHAYPAVLPPVIDALSTGQFVIVSGALSLVPLWIRERMKARGIEPAVIAAWGTTLGTARRTPTADVRLNTVRARFDMAALPARSGESALSVCRQLFSDRFVLADNVLAVALANVNPIAHAAETLPNLTRIDRKEDWPLFHYLTVSGARMCAALDRERLSVAAAFGEKVRSIEEHYRLSYHVDGEDIASIAEAIHAKYQGPLGPKTLEHRYVLEDVPYGLVFIEALARCASVEVPNISGSIALLSSACGRDFRADNPLLNDLAIVSSTPAELLARSRNG